MKGANVSQKCTQKFGALIKTINPRPHAHIFITQK